jgi:hypothetical protein
MPQPRPAYEQAAERHQLRRGGGPPTARCGIEVCGPNDVAHSGAVQKQGARVLICMLLSEVDEKYQATRDMVHGCADAQISRQPS